MKALKNGQTYIKNLTMFIYAKDNMLWYVWPFFKAFIKPFKVPQRSVKIKIQVNLFFSSGMGMGSDKYQKLFCNFS